MLFHKLGMALSDCVVEAGFGAFAHSAIWLYLLLVMMSGLRRGKWEGKGEVGWSRESDTGVMNHDYFSHCDNSI